MSSQGFCQCPNPVCSDCQLPIKSAVDYKSVMQAVKRELLDSGDLAAITNDKMERCINYTVISFPKFSYTQAALERKDSMHIVLSTLFNEMDSDFEAMRFFIRVLKLQEENQLVVQKLLQYSRKLGEEEDDDDENLTPCVQCSSPPKSPAEGVQVNFFPPLQYVRDEYPPGLDKQSVGMRDEAQENT